MEETEDAGAGTCPGDWPRRPRYAVGDEVEVLTGKGFRGARFEATVTACLPRSGKYKVVYSDLVVRRGGPHLREAVAAADVRPRPPPVPPGREVELFDLVEAYHSDGWWPGVVSGILPKRRRNQQARFAVSLPLFREVLELSASLVRPRQEFVCGSWMDAQEVLRGIPLYEEGSIVEVMYDEEKKGTAWRPATIVKMVGGTNYVVNYGNGESSIEVEVYHDGIWIRGVIADVGSCEPRRYRVKVQPHNNTLGDDYLLVSSSLLRPYSKWGGQERRLRSTKEHAKKRHYPESDYSAESFIPGGNSDQYSYIPNKRVRKEDLQLRFPLNLRQDTARSALKDAMDIEISSEKHVSRLKKLESDSVGLGFRVAKGKDQVLEASALEKLIYARYDGKGTPCLPKAPAGKRKDIISVSSRDDIIEIGSKSSISDNSSCGSLIEINDSSSYNPNIKKWLVNLTDGEIHSNHQAQYSALSLCQVQNSYNKLRLEVTSHPEGQECRNVLSQSMAPLESSQDPSHKDGEQEIPLSGSLVQKHHGGDETIEPRLSDHLENVLMTFDDSAAGGENHEMSQNVTEAMNWVAGTCNRADTGLTNTENSDQKTVDQSFVGAFPIGKLEPSSSRQQDVEGDLFCIESPNGNKVNTRSFVTDTLLMFLLPSQVIVPESRRGMKNHLQLQGHFLEVGIKKERTGVSRKKAAAPPIWKLEPSLSAQQDVKANLLCIEAPNDIKMEMTKERAGMSPEVAAGFHLETCMPPANEITAVPECYASSLHPSVIQGLVPLTVPNNSVPPFSFITSLLLMPNHKMEVFNKLPQNPHFREAWNCPPEFREGRALGLMVSFANMAESIRNMRIQDGPQLYQEKMNRLLDLEENGFDVHALKFRLDNLLHIRNHHIHLKSRKERLEKEIFEMKGVNSALERHLKFLDIIMWVDKKYQEMKNSVGMQKAANCLSISKLQVDLHQVEESLVSAEANFCSIATAPWQSERDLNYGLW